ncbi:hypothetical protein HXZ94_07445 [Empedobacter falsenii]|uniref:hypothetical protein n=1 Tax=Empedobacter falsenii TaxID=343874 RepID=UPI00257828BF|nr:hypothetical protein [Empedobacter falsenii]MDM1298335.1 hypothetical protein [Empedobacter falsenii]MDM1318108.1 hypothetical protein [Empedobacter falsenii]
MKIKFLTTVLLSFIAFFSVKAQNNSELDKAIVKTITALNKQDFSTINDMILKDFGVAILFRRGVNDNLAFVDNLDKNQPIPEYLPYDYLGNVNVNSKINHETLPKFDCDTEKFTKKNGIYCDVASKYNDVSETALSENKYVDVDWKPKHIAKMKEIEKNSRKIMAYSDEGVLVFYLTFYKNKWYFTMLDRFEVCSA